MSANLVSEHGRFYVGPHGSLRFAGSASGVWLADMVRYNVPSLQEDAADIEQAFLDRNSATQGIDLARQPQAADPSGTTTLLRSRCLQPHQLQNKADSKRLFDEYFATWHPLFPFLDGKATVGQLNRLFDSALVDASDADALCISAIISSLISIGRLGQGPIAPDALFGFSSGQDASSMAYLIVQACDESLVNDMQALQALVAVDLYLYATRKHRQASHLCGLIVKIAVESGLHRCPGRYPLLFASRATQDLRKRLLYSIYVLDRLLALELGSPIMLSDTDIDVCLPGTVERHGTTAMIAPDSPSVPPMSTPNTGDKRKREQPAQQMPFSSPSTASNRLSMDGRTRHHLDTVRLLPALALIRITAISGRLMETFNKSRKYRLDTPGHIAALRADVDEWWNEMDFDAHDGYAWGAKYRMLFTCLYHQQIIHFHRQSLALKPDQVQHRYALQSMIISSRKICSTLSSSLSEDRRSAFWPGYVDMTFYSCLVLVYAARHKQEALLGSSLTVRGDLRRALQVVQVLHDRWGNLESLLRVIQALATKCEDGLDQQEANLQTEPFMNDPPAAFGDIGDSFAELLAFDFSNYLQNSAG